LLGFRGKRAKPRQRQNETDTTDTDADYYAQIKEG
jgi:hypothetical protein